MFNLKRIFKNGNIVDRIFIIVVPVVILFGLKDLALFDTELGSSSINEMEGLSLENGKDLGESYTEESNIKETSKNEVDNEEASSDESVIKENIEEKVDMEVNNNEQPYIFFKKSIKGRGRSDEGRSEPNYIGLYGYGVVYDGYDVRKLSLNSIWTFPIYKKIDYDHYEVDGELEHKTIIKVISQDWIHKGYGSYSGYLTVIIPGEEDVEYLINVSNFITNDYWNFNSVYASTDYGYSVAEYNQTSDKLPVYVNNDIVQIQDSIKVIIKGKTGMYSSGKVDNDLRQIEAYYLDENGVERTIFFNENDLKIIYWFHYKSRNNNRKL